MPSGFQVFNDNNIIQIDADYRNLLLIKSGQFTANDTTTAQDLWYSQNLSTWMNTTPHAILVTRCVGPTNKMTLTPGTYRNGYKITNFFYPQLGQASFQYYIYDMAPANPAHKTGMQVFNAAGELVYSSLDYALKIVDVTTTVGKFTNLLYNGSNTNLAYACVGGGHTISSGGGGVQSTFVRTWWEGTQLKWEEVVYYNAGTVPEAYGLPDQYGMIVDVSNVPLNYSRY